MNAASVAASFAAVPLPSSARAVFEGDDPAVFAALGKELFPYLRQVPDPGGRQGRCYHPGGSAASAAVLFAIYAPNKKRPGSFRSPAGFPNPSKGSHSSSAARYSVCTVTNGRTEALTFSLRAPCRRRPAGLREPDTPSS